jgi:hypothetical protein
MMREGFGEARSETGAGETNLETLLEAQDSHLKQADPRLSVLMLK